MEHSEGWAIRARIRILVYDVWIYTHASRVLGGLADEEEGHCATCWFWLDVTYPLCNWGYLHAELGLLAWDTASSDFIAQVKHQLTKFN